MRQFSDEFLEAYLLDVGDDVLKSVGCYQLEGPGVQLFEAVNGDYFAILGLPLVPLLAASCAQRGAVMSARYGVVGWPVAHSRSPSSIITGCRQPALTLFMSCGRAA